MSDLKIFTMARLQWHTFFGRLLTRARTITPALKQCSPALSGRFASQTSSAHSDDPNPHDCTVNERLARNKRASKKSEENRSSQRHANFRASPSCPRSVKMDSCKYSWGFVFYFFIVHSVNSFVMNSLPYLRRITISLLRFVPVVLVHAEAN